MALDYSKFASSDDQHALFDKAPFDIGGARKKLVARIDRASKQFNGEITMKGGSDFERGHHNQIKFRPLLNGHAITLPGMKDDYFPTNSDSFEGLLNAIRADVNAGKFDDQLEAMPQDAGKQGKSARASSSGGKGGAGKYRQSSLPEREDKIPHRVPAEQAQPHDSYTLNKQKTLWRSPEQVAADDERSERRKATIAKGK